MKSNRTPRPLSKWKALSLLAAAAAAAVAAGCGSGTATTTVVPGTSTAIGLPAETTAAFANTYDGGQSPGEWIFTLDNTKDAFSYQAVTYPAAAVSGALQAGSGFTSLGAGASGMAYEVLGRAAILRPGSSATSPIFAVPQTQCYAIGGKMRFQYISMFPGSFNIASLTSSDQVPLGYGSIVASTDSTGKSWQFENLQGGIWTTADGTAGTIVFGPASFTGACATANGQAAIALSGTSLLDEYWAPEPSILESAPPTATKSNVWIGPSGFFAADQSDPAQTSPTGASVAGIAEPSAALSTSALAAGTYLGFLYEAPTVKSTPTLTAYTAPVGFGQVVAGSGSTLTGGVFPNDDVSGTPNSDTQINLGAEDSTYNGLYKSVSITVSDPAQNCANFSGQFSGYTPDGVSWGVDALGYPTCTFPAVAVAGNPDGKYAVFINSYDWSANLGGVPLTIYLFQQ